MKTQILLLHDLDRGHRKPLLAVILVILTLLSFQGAIAGPFQAHALRNSNGDLLPAPQAGFVSDGDPGGAIVFPDATSGVSSWTGGAGSWSDGTMWNPAGAPNSTDADVSVDNANPVASAVAIDGNFTVGRLMIDAGDSVTLLDNRAFLITDSGTFTGRGSMVNNGTFTLSTGGNATDLRIGGNIIVSGTGTITTNNSQANRIFGQNGNDLLTIGAGQTVQGSMQFGVDLLRFVNNGTINANQSAGLTIDPTNNVGDAVNNGTMQASNGASLQLNFGNYTNTNGTIRALAGSAVNLNGNATIIGGTLTTTDLTGTGGVIQTINNASLQDVTNTGYLRIPDNTTLRLVGTLTNNGLLVLASGGNPSDLRINSDVTISGTGSVSGNNSQANRIFGVAGTERLTIASGQTVQGSMQFGVDLLKFTNNGLIDANLGNGIIVDPTNAAGDAINTGTMQASNGSILRLEFGNYTNANGTIRALAGSVVNLAGNATIVGGTITTTNLSGTGGAIQTVNTASFQDLTNTGYVNIQDNTTLRLFGTITNNGLFLINSGGNATDLRIADGAMLTGTGVVTTSNTQANRILGLSTGTERLTIASGMIIQGSMQFGADFMKFTNNGTIDANQSQGITIDPQNDADGAINNGTLQASNGSTLTLGFGTYTNNGTIRALDNSFVGIRDNARIVGGILTTAGSGVVGTVNTASLENVTNNGLFRINDNTELRLFGTLVNNGTLMLNSGGNTTDLRIGNDVTISGSGTFTSSNTQNNRILGLTGTERLTVASGYTLQGSYQFGADLMKFTNNGTIDSNMSAGITIDPTNNVGDAINNGTLQASNGSTLTMSFGNYTNNGTIRALNNSFVNIGNNALIVGGTITTVGTGAVQTFNDASLQDVTNNGLFNIPDNTRLRLFGSFVNNGTLMLSSGGNNTELRIGNDLTLSGTGVLTSSNTQANRILGVVGSERVTIASGYTLQGSFQFGADFLKFTNNGTINANTSAGLTVDPTNALGDAVNNGLMEATSGATLTLGLGTYSNGSGVIQALSGSFVNIRDGALIIGGILTTTDLSGTGGVIGTVNDISLQDLTNNGLFRINDNTRLRLIGTIVNNGLMQMNSAGNTTEIRLNGDVTLSGNGMLTGSNTLANLVYGLTTGSETLTNGPLHTINGTMQLGSNFMNLINNGVIDSNTSNITIDPTSTATNNASGVFRASNGATLNLINGTYTNNGTYEALTGSVVQMNSGAALTNYDSGTMTLTGGTYRSVSTGGQSTLNLNIGQIVNNAAAIVLDGVNTIIHTSDNSTDALTSFNNNTAGGSFTITNGRNFDRTFAFNNAGLVTVGLNSLFTTVQFDLSGALTGVGTLTDSGPFNWTAGTQSGAGITNLNGAFNITTAANKFLDARTLNAAATTTWSGADNISAGNGATINNLAGATFNAQAAQSISYSGTGPAASFNNSGTFNKSGAGSTTSLDAIYNNSGTTNVNSGTLALQRGGTDSGSFVDASGAALTFGGGTHSLSATSSTTGAGAVNFSLGIANFANGAVYNISGLTTINGGTANFNNSATAAGTVLSSGALGGSGSYASSGLFTWSGGTMNGGGTTNANGGLSLNGGLKTLLSRTLNNNNAANWSAGNISSGLGAIFNNNNAATFDNSFDGSWLFDQGGSITQFNNAGTFTKSAGTGTTTMQVAFTNTGALNVNSGTLSFSQGEQGTSGTVSTAAGATLDVSAGANASSAATLTNNGSLSLGSNNFNVASDYLNANFGTGNSFDPRANVTGTGGINATGNVNQSLTGNVTNGTTAAPTMAFGNFHVGDASVTKNYTINNTGSSGPVLRGAIQTAANGGNITDGRLSGSGVTPANFGPLALGASTGNLGVTFTPGSAGALNGQVVHLINNFDNVQDQNLSITGAVFRLASASAHSPEPVTLPNVHVGDVDQTGITITNTATNDNFSEKLDATFGTPTGNATASGSVALLAPGSSDSSSLIVGLDTSVAGARSGAVPLNLTSNGSGTSGLGTTPLLPSQTVNVSGNVYRLASASAHTPDPVAFGTVHIGETPSQAVSVTNNAVNDAFSEKLDGSIAASGGVTASGSFSLLAPGSPSSSLSVGIDTSTAGNKNGTATISLTSDGTGTSGLANTSLASQTVNVTGQVNFFADPVVIFKSGSATLTMNSATSFTLSFGQVAQNSGTYMASFGVQNSLHDATFQDSLGGSFNTTNVSNFGVSGFGNFSGIIPGGALDPNVSFDSSQSVGNYTNTVTLTPTSSNASGTSNLSDVTLTLQGQIIVVPEPNTWAMLFAGGGMLVVARRYVRRRD